MELASLKSFELEAAQALTQFSGEKVVFVQLDGITPEAKTELEKASFEVVFD